MTVLKSKMETINQTVGAIPGLLLQVNNGGQKCFRLTVKKIEPLPKPH